MKTKEQTPLAPMTVNGGNPIAAQHISSADSAASPGQPPAPPQLVWSAISDGYLLSFQEAGFGDF